MAGASSGNVMTAEEFLVYVNCYSQYRDKGKQRLNRTRELYRVYCLAYREQSLKRLTAMAFLHRGQVQAVWKAAEDRDENRPMAQVPELLL